MILPSQDRSRRASALQRKSDSNKVLVVGLDGATFDLLLPWIQEGKLPTFSKLIRNGSRCNLRSTIPMFTATAWSTFITGKNPGGHGVAGFFTRKRGSYDLSLSSLNDCAKDLLSILSEEGKKVVAINVPMTYPPKKVNGYIISGMMTPPNSLNFCCPESLGNLIRREVCEYEIRPRMVYEEGKEDEFVDEIIRITDIRMRTALYLLRNTDWDFFMIVFNGTDQIQHALWKHLDCRHPQHDRDKSKRYRALILKYFEKIDGIVERFLSNVGEDTNMLVISDHGFGPLYFFIHVNTWLRNQGLLRLKRQPLTLLKRFLFRLGLTPQRMYNLLLRIHFGKIRSQMGREKGHEVLRRFFLSFSDVDWGKTRAYSLGAMGQIFINLAGREPQGIVSPDQYNELLQRIILDLGNLADPRTGLRIIKEIYTRDDVYKGVFLDRMPDIVFIPMPGYIGFEEFEFASNSVLTPPRGISGTHRPKGIFIASGPLIRKRSNVEEVRIEDLAPLLLYILGVPIPHDMDGTVPLGLLDEKYVESNPVKIEKQRSSSTFKVKKVYRGLNMRERKQQLSKRG